LQKYIERENEQLRIQSQQFQEEIKKLQSENKKTNRKMHKMLDLGKPSQKKRSERIARSGGGLNILINAVGIP
jgi:hypothetical protein